MSQPFQDISITNAGTRACTLTGYPRITVAGHRGWPDEPTTAAPLNIAVHHGIYEREDPGPHRVVLRPQHEVFFSIGTANAYEGPIYTLTRLTVILPGPQTPKALPISLLANGPPGRRIPVGTTAINRNPLG